MKEEIWIISTTLETEDQARDLALKAVEQGLASCAQIEKTVESIYIWKGATEVACETRVLLKVSASRKGPLAAWIIKNHSYDIPEVLCWAAESANPDYTKWVENP